MFIVQKNHLLADYFDTHDHWVTCPFSTFLTRNYGTKLHEKKDKQNKELKNNKIDEG